MAYRLSQIADYLGIALVGDKDIEIHAIAPLETAQAGQISFLSNMKLAKLLDQSQASAVIVKEAQGEGNWLISHNPYLSYAQLSALFDDAPKASGHIAKTAIIHESATIGEGVSIGDYAVIGAYSVIGDACVIDANTVISERCTLGKACHLYANVTLYHNVSLGDEVFIHSGSVIGADGFGYAPGNAPAKWQKIYQLGGVRIGNKVSIGANTCIDRGALADTIIHDGVIIDNLVQIAHNCDIGENTAIAGCVGIAGSSIIGKNCTIAGQAGISGHLTICDNVHVGGSSRVTGSIKQAGAYTAGTPLMEATAWRKSAVRFSQLDSLHDRVKQLEKSHR